jgi:uncharacterized YigZ family protein
MVTQFKSVLHEAEAEIVIKKSRFIGHVSPITNEEEAIAFVGRVKKLHSSATHNCFAYLIGERDEIQKQSDDGEPSGTAGKPILDVIKHQGLSNVAVVVTRYFGGVMLGAGGLIRAYTDGAVAGLAAAEPIYQVSHREVLLHIAYTWLGKVENELRHRNVMLGETRFTDRVTVCCYPLAEEADAFTAWLTDLTQGQGVVNAGDYLFKVHRELQVRSF